MTKCTKAAIARMKAKVKSIDNAQGTLLDLLLFTLPVVKKYLMCHRDLHSMDTFSGMKAVTCAIAQKQLAAEALDKTYANDPSMDLLTSAGFQHALSTACRLKTAATAWAAPVCSSRAWVSRSTSGRSPQNP